MLAIYSSIYACMFFFAMSRKPRSKKTQTFDTNIFAKSKSYSKMILTCQSDARMGWFSELVG